MSLKLVAAAFVICASPLVAAQPKHPDLSGQWRQDIAASKALTEQKGLTWRVAGGSAAPGGGAAAPSGATVLSPVTTITQSEKELVFERRLDNEVISRDVYKLDGTTSVNASRISTTRSTTTWKGAALVTTGTLEMDASNGEFVDKNGKPLPSITRQFVTTRFLMPDGTMQIESRSVQNGETRVSWSVLARVKPS